MRDLPRIITGIIMVLFGTILILLPLFFTAPGLILTLIWGIPLFIFGIVILLNKKEKEIEPVASSAKKAGRVKKRKR